MIEIIADLPWFLAGVGAAGLATIMTLQEPISKKDVAICCGIPGLIGVLWLMITVHP